MNLEIERQRFSRWASYRSWYYALFQEESGFYYAIADDLTFEYGVVGCHYESILQALQHALESIDMHINGEIFEREESDLVITLAMVL